MKLKNILFFIIIVIALYLYDSTETYSIIIDQDEQKTTNETIYINPKKQEIPININAIHTIEITPKMIPLQLFINKNQLVKWKNKLNTNQIIICDDNDGNNIFISNELHPSDFYTYIFTKKGKYAYYNSTNNLDINYIIVN